MMFILSVGIKPFTRKSAHFHLHLNLFEITILGSPLLSTTTSPTFIAIMIFGLQIPDSVHVVHKKRQEPCLSKESLWTGPTAIDILPICTTPRMVSKHTKLDCPSAVKKLSRFSLLDELPFCSGYFPSR